PKYAEFEEDETGKVTSAQLRGESQDALARREGKEVFPRSSFFVLPADPALYQDTTFVARK
ncbi:MAG TPA: hypothetical protein VK338_03920, partial [Candidatus Nitrosocosmicus sp.]|nr:hypothetical protein [Candidatus Nitrosocosmicus sp.]